MNVWGIARGHRVLLLAGTLLGILGAAATLAQPLAIGEMIKAVAGDRSLLVPILLAAALFVTDAALAAAHAYAIGRAGENIVFDIRHVLTARLLRSRTAAFARWEQGDVFTRMVTDTSLARICMAQALAQIVTSGFMVLGGIALMAWIDPLLLAVTLLCLGLASVVSLLLARRVRKVAVINREDTSDFGSALMRVLGAMSTVKASRAEERETERITGFAQKARRSGVRVSALSAMLTPAMNVGTQVALTVVIAWGMARVATGAMPPADLTSFMMYLFYLVSPLVMLFMSIAQFQQGRAALDRIGELAGIEQEELDPDAAHVATRGHAIAFDRVSFTYPGSEEAVLDEVSFTVPDKGLTAIVGPSGAGKTTVFQLIERFYGPDSGTVLMGGTDTATMPLEQIRGQIGYVEQDHSLMRGTIRENLTYAAPDAGEKEIADALRMAHLGEVIRALPEGLETELGERGAGLSGGQKQRLAIARTLLQRPEIVLLDEATANLDSEAEDALRDTITAISGTCAVIAIAHRISTITQADQIIVLDRGGVRATGTHTELTTTDDLYQRLSRHQEVAA
ncbi:ABC transporter ATP-binding protein [Streptomyces sp. L-9-10]|uniref:ABC transporter ATP-binding protein n=1 Tax=Streptomyces sp. L-9-10 TaxID=1478131 RepID=UPI00101DC0A1|nr:ABC transporter ATP-binding protein [Streptomyces sp. L-9-10]RYJ19974.1 ABC transporter ATP-binding protein [Streptomyces sp. L-9-10]